MTAAGAGIAHESRSVSDVLSLYSRRVALTAVTSKKQKRVNHLPLDNGQPTSIRGILDKTAYMDGLTVWVN